MNTRTFNLLMLLCVGSSVFAETNIPAHRVSEAAKKWVSFDKKNNCLTIQGVEDFHLQTDEASLFNTNAYSLDQECCFSPDGRYVALIRSYGKKSLPSEYANVYVYDAETCQEKFSGILDESSDLDLSRRVDIRVQSAKNGPKVYLKDKKDNTYCVCVAKTTRDGCYEVEVVSDADELCKQCDWDNTKQVDVEAFKSVEIKDTEDTTTPTTTTSNSTEKKSGSSFLQFAQKYRFWIAGGVIATICATGLGYWLYAKNATDDTTVEDEFQEIE